MLKKIKIKFYLFNQKRNQRWNVQ